MAALIDKYEQLTDGLKVHGYYDGQKFGKGVIKKDRLGHIYLCQDFTGEFHLSDCAGFRFASWLLTCQLEVN